jgi:siroheme synthase
MTDNPTVITAGELKPCPVTQADRNTVHRLLADKAFTARRVLPNGQRVMEGAVPYADVLDAFARHRITTEQATAQAERERIAEIVHDAMVWAAQQGGHPIRWCGGNSFAEGRARQAATAIRTLSQGDPND